MATTKTRDAAGTDAVRRVGPLGLRGLLGPRGLGAGLAAVGLSFALAACGSMGPGPVETAPVSTTAPADAAATDAAADDTSQCALVLDTLTGVRERIEALPDKLPGDIPGAIDDVQTSVTELTELSQGLQEGELKTHVDNIIAHGDAALSILNQAQSGEITVIEAVAQGTAEISALQQDIAALDDYCSAA